MDVSVGQLPEELPDLSKVGFVCLLWPGITGSWGASVYRADGTHLRHLMQCGSALDADEAARAYIAGIDDRLEVAVVTLASQAAIPPVLAEVLARLHTPPALERSRLH